MFDSICCRRLPFRGTDLELQRRPRARQRKVVEADDQDITLIDLQRRIDGHLDGKLAGIRMDRAAAGWLADA